MSVAFYPSLVYLPFVVLLSLFFCLLLALEAVFRSCEIKVHMGDFAQNIDTVFINPVI